MSLYGPNGPSVSEVRTGNDTLSTPLVVRQSPLALDTLLYTQWDSRPLGRLEPLSLSYHHNCHIMKLTF